jgi:hypothetical protein
MSTRACLIELKKEKCNIGYIHYGLDYVEYLFKQFYDIQMDEEIEIKMQEAKEQWDNYQEVTDKEIIGRLYQYDTEAVDVDALIFIFVEDKGHYKDITIRYSL